MPNIKELGNIAYILGFILIPVCGYFVKRLLDQYDAKIIKLNQDVTLLRDDHDELKDRFNCLYGEHCVMMHKAHKGRGK